MKDQPYGAYSQRFSNYVATQAANKETTDPSTGYSLRVTSADPSMGEAGAIKLASFSTQTAEAAQTVVNRGGDSYPVYRATAKAYQGYRFVGWKTNIDAVGNTTINPIEFPLTKDTYLVAQFEAVGAATPTTETHTVRVNWDETKGRVACNGMQDGVVTVDNGDSVTLTATPKTGYVFAGWTGVNLGGNVQNNQSKTITLTVTRDYNLTANFKSESGTNSDNVGGGSNSGTGAGAGVVDVVNVENVNDGGSLFDKVIPFVKKWWWALLIVAYVIYKDMKGGSK